MTQHHTFIKGETPLVITAIHDGHEVRDELKNLFSLDEEARLREEDPFTANWTFHSDNRIIVHHSRFEVDVNRPREKAVYRRPEDAWGLEVWKKPLPQDVLDRSLQIYDDFYASAKSYFDELLSVHDKIIVYDIHSYNHQRDGKVADQDQNPDVNIGTGNMNREIWEPVVETLIDCFESFNFDGKNLDVRENVKFRGGYFGKWLYEQYGDAICPISIEFKKIFMDELTGKGYENDIYLICHMVKTSIKDVLNTINKVDTCPKNLIHF
jgi:N-formylglutamate deformylase